MSRPILLALLFFSFVTACAKAPPQTSSSGAGRQAVDPELAEKLGRAVHEITANQAGLDYLSAFAQVSVERGKQRRLFDAVLQAAPPDRLSLLVLNDLGQEVASVIADGNEVLFHDFEKGESRRFAQDDEALRKALRLPITVKELVDRILLRLPSAEILEAYRKNSTLGNLDYWVLRRGDTLRLAEAQGFHLSLYEALGKGEKSRYQVEYSDYASVGTREFPHRIALGFRKPAINLTLKLQKVSFAPPASRSIEASFDTRPPRAEP